MLKKYFPIVIFALIILIVMILAITGLINESIGMCISLGLLSILNLLVAIIAFKNDVKIVGVVMLLFLIVGLSLLVFNLYSVFNSRVNNEYDFQITVKEKESPKTLIFNHDGKNYYTYNLSEVNLIISHDDKVESLENAFKNDIVKLEDILNLAIANDGTLGYKIYYDGGVDKYQNDTYSVVVCENNNDVIFSTFNYVTIIFAMINVLN